MRQYLIVFLITTCEKLEVHEIMSGGGWSEVGDKGRGGHKNEKKFFAFLDELAQN